MSYCERLKKINEFRKEFMGKHYKPLTRKGFEEILSQENVLPHCYYNDIGEIIGYVTISFVKTLTKNTALVEDLIIDKEYTGMGYGTDLMKEVLTIAKNRKMNCVEVCAKNTNKKALGLYKKLGFKDRKNKALRLWLV